ncbi:Spo0E family sporulation regulatory protein-aspartic acid phosphatase [Peribacillus sp. SCS-155]|uniref:Spo0E family sporulation regulatory protein-aspartic acid phosphatase n=1 Tax=Peribacillus sedimenti TaxID=3115297 RepID=UPI003906B673
MTKTEYLALIEKKRTELIQIVSKNGLDSRITLEFSQELDRLLNQYNSIYYKVQVSRF